MSTSWSRTATCAGFPWPPLADSTGEAWAERRGERTPATHRYRLVYRRQGPARFASHLDVVRTLERAARRARLPVAYSQGFNPHVRFGVAAPLAVGWTAAADVVDLELTTEVAPAALVEAFNRALPRGLEVVCAGRVPASAPAVMAQVRAATYVVKAAVDDGGVEAVRDAVARFLGATEVVTTRPGAHQGAPRRVDVRPLVLACEVVGEERDPLDGRPVAVLRVRLRVGSRANLKPELLLEALAPPRLVPLAVHREALELEQ